jgi:hypothetical protein
MPDFENIQNEFDLPIEEPETKQDENKIVVSKSQAGLTDLDLDYTEIRSNLKDIIKRGAEAIDGILTVASETQQPRAYEVVATLIKSVSDANKDLLTMHRQMQDLKSSTGNQSQSATSITNNSIFVGSTSELQSIIKGRLEQLRQIDE